MQWYNLSLTHTIHSFIPSLGLEPLVQDSVLFWYVFACLFVFLGTLTELIFFKGAAWGFLILIVNIESKKQRNKIIHGEEINK